MPALFSQARFYCTKCNRLIRWADVLGCWVDSHDRAQCQGPQCGHRPTLCGGRS